MRQSEIYRENADNCAQLAEGAKLDASFKRYKRMEAAWLALAEEQDWLDGERSPIEARQRDAPPLPNRAPAHRS